VLGNWHSFFLIDLPLGIWYYAEMKLVKYFDIHDKEVTPVVYTLFFALVESKGNDIVYQQYVESWCPEMGEGEDCEPWDDDCYRGLEKLYEEHIGRGWNNCFHDSAAMKAFYENPPPIKEAIAQCWEWLKKQGITKDDEFFCVKLWW